MYLVFKLIGGSYTASDRFLVDASYFAIKNITLGYTIPKQWLKKAGLESVRIFGSVDNLALFSHLDGMDPQYNFKGETDYSYAPNKTYSVGFEINSAMVLFIHIEADLEPPRFITSS